MITARSYQMSMNKADFCATVLIDESMARHTSWKVGGVADRFYAPSDIADLTAFLSSLDEHEPLTWLGLGSNVLVRDKGIRGTVVSLKNMQALLEATSETTVLAGAGVACAKVARFAANNGLTGGEFLAGIPGSMGGALAMNAGAFGGETWGIVKAVETISRTGERIRREASAFSRGYRYVHIPDDEWFISAVIRLDKDIQGMAKNNIKALLSQRAEMQPVGQFSCGSVFQNPKGDFAGRLIEACSLKGYCIGGAFVSEKHANFIINNGNATAADIEMLIAHIQNKVQEQFAIRLTREVKIIGEA